MLSEIPNFGGLHFVKISLFLIPAIFDVMDLPTHPVAVVEEIMM